MFAFRSNRQGIGCLASEQRKLAGFTLVELILVIAIVGLLMSLLLPALHSAREQARAVACSNKVRQLGTAFLAFEATHRQYPMNGWGYAWLGDSTAGFGENQPGCWLFSILPFIEQQTLYEAFDGRPQPPFETTIPLFYCPSRRLIKAYPYTLESIKLRNADNPQASGKCDYAVCQGDILVRGGPGPESKSAEAIAKYRWTPTKNLHGVCGPRLVVRSSSVVDGLANTLLIAEKGLYMGDYTTGASLGDDQSPFVGDDIDNHRSTVFTPVQDFNHNDTEAFGGPHPGGINTVMCDGSTRPISFGIDAEVFRQMGTRNEREASRNSR